MSTENVGSVDVHRSLGDLVAERPSTARVLERHGLDYCCNGHRSLAEASASAGVDPLAIAAELAELADDPGDDVGGLGPAELAEHILATHHAYLHEELPLLDALAEKVRGVHGSRHAELDRVAELVAETRAELEPHLAKEERVLFPAIKELADGRHEFAFGSVANPIRVMMLEHDRAGDLLRRLRAASDDYRVPDDACASYRQLYERLETLESDTHRHIHLENNVLFPAVLGAE